MKKLILVGLICGLLAACGEDNDPINDVKEAAKDVDLQGKNFASECQLKPLETILTGILTGGEAAIKSATVIYRFDGGQVARSTRLFISADCTGDTAISTVETGTIHIDPDQKTQDLGKSIDIDFNGLTVTTVTEAGAQAANAIQLCSANDWGPNSERDQTARAKDANCYGAEVPRRVSNIYRVDAGVLYFGPKIESSSERPAALDMNTKYIGQ